MTHQRRRQTIVCVVLFVAGGALLSWDQRGFLLYALGLFLLAWREFRQSTEAIGVELIELKDGGLEIEVRVRRLEAHLLTRKQTEDDGAIDYLKELLGRIRRRQIHEKLEPDGVAGAYTIQDLIDKLGGGLDDLSDLALRRRFRRRGFRPRRKSEEK